MRVLVFKFMAFRIDGVIALEEDVVLDVMVLVLEGAWGFFGPWQRRNAASANAHYHNYTKSCSTN